MLSAAGEPSGVCMVTSGCQEAKTTSVVLPLKQATQLFSCVLTIDLSLLVMNMYLCYLFNHYNKML